MERTGIIRGKGKPLTLVGQELKIGLPAPDFRLVDANLNLVTLSDTTGYVRVFSIVPSIDTNICAIQTKTFNVRAQQLADEIKLYGVSVDLPFAQSRFVEAKRIDRLKMLSDYQERSFGMNWGMLVRENKLLARAVVILDKDDTVRYVQLVPETSNEPDYEDALNALRDVAVART
ncbi:MAG: thiol peroxidase [candidate division Zixibacteria bacterium]|nr:thiol peroxidase [candidate division Zixibacteria bacterium]